MPLFKDFYDEYISQCYPTLDVHTASMPPQVDGMIISVSRDAEDIYRAITFFSIMGVDVNTIDCSLDNLRGLMQNGTQYVGVIAGEFGLFDGRQVSDGTNGGYRMMHMPDSSRDGIAPLKQLGWTSIICETPEASAFLGFLLDRNGQTWYSGTPYPQSDMFFGRDALDRGKVYDIVDNLHCTIGDSPAYGHGVEGTGMLQSLIFDTDVMILPPLNTLRIEDLMLGGIYVYNAPYIGTYSESSRRVIFKLMDRNINGRQLMISGNGRCVWNNSMFTEYPRYPILSATLEEKSEFRRLYREYQLRQAEDRAYRYQALLSEREYNKKNHLANTLNNYNSDVPTQLFSVSMHKYLYKVWSTSRIARTLLKLNDLGHLKGVTRNITISRSTQEMTYTLPNKETVMTENFKWEKKSRQSGKYGKIIRKVLTEQVPRFKFTDQELETLVNHLKACAENGEFQIVSGDDIMYWYDGNRYADDEDTGTLGCSCMRHNPSYMELYAKNPDVCQMVILVKGGCLYGRALLWNNKYMDRIYGSDSTIVAFKSYAKKKGYHCKSYQNSDCTDSWIDPENGEHYNETMTISLDTNCEYYPYADTFYYIDVEEGYISNSDDCGNGAQLRSTDGDIYDDERVYDEIDDRYIYEGDAVYLNSRGIYTHVDNARYCDIEQEYYLEEDMVELDNGQYVSLDAYGVVYVDEDDVYTLSDLTFTCDHDNTLYAESCHDAVYIDELNITVMEDNVPFAYEEAGYIFVDELNKWVSDEEYAEMTANNE